MNDALPKILITNFHPKHGGGHYTYVKTLCSSELCQHFSCAIGSAPGSALEDFAKEINLKHFRIGFPGNLREIRDIIRSVRALDSIHKRFPFEIIHTNGSRDHWIAIYWKLIYGRPAHIIRTRHAIKIESNDLLHRIVNNRLTSFNIYVSSSAKRICQSEWGVQSTNTVVIPNGVDVDFFHPMPRNSELALAHGISEDDFVFGSVAGLGAYKRVDLFLKALSELALPRNVKVLVLGQKNRAQHLIRLAAELRLGEKFIYGGHQEDVRQYVSLFHVGFILSDAVETLSYASREMMAMGVPLISSNFSGLTENVDHDVNGILVSPANLDEIKSAILRFINMPPDELRLFSTEARKKAEGVFSLKSQIQPLHDLYTLTLSRPNQRA